MLYFRGETFIFQDYRIGVVSMCEQYCRFPTFISLSQSDCLCQPKRCSTA